MVLSPARERRHRAEATPSRTSRKAKLGLGTLLGPLLSLAGIGFDLRLMTLRLMLKVLRRVVELVS